MGTLSSETTELRSDWFSDESFKKPHLCRWTHYGDRTPLKCHFISMVSVEEVSESGDYMRVRVYSRNGIGEIYKAHLQVWGERVEWYDSWVLIEEYDRNHLLLERFDFK